jgi:hypothetical protein
MSTGIGIADEDEDILESSMDVSNLDQLKNGENGRADLLAGLSRVDIGCPDVQDVQIEDNELELAAVSTKEKSGGRQGWERVKEGMGKKRGTPHLFSPQGFPPNDPNLQASQIGFE